MKYLSTFAAIICMAFILIGCKKPLLVEQEGKKYSLTQWEGGTFVYVTYNWKGGKYDDAMQLISAWQKVVHDRGLEEQVIGRFPTSKKWQLGIIIKEQLTLMEVGGYSIESMEIPAGTYGTLLTKGYPDKIAYYWKKFKEWLEEDGHSVLSPAFEIYHPDFLDALVPDEERSGELRYRIQ